MKNAKGNPSFTRFLAVVLFCTIVFSMTACATTNNANDSPVVVVADNQPGNTGQQSPQDPQPPQEQEAPPDYDTPEADPPSDNDDTMTVPANVQWLIGRWALVATFDDRVALGFPRLTSFLSLGADGIAWEGSYFHSEDTEITQEGSRIANFDSEPFEHFIIGPWVIEGNNLTIERSPEAMKFGLFAPRTWIIDVVSEDEILLREMGNPDNNFSTLRRFVD